MADIKQISVDGTVYDIKDETARNQTEALLSSLAETAEDVGDITRLNTTNKTSLVDAVNEVAANSGTSYTYGTEDLVAGESALETGKLYFVYE